MIDFSTIETLWDSFLLHHFALSIIIQGIKLAMGQCLINHPCPSIITHRIDGDEDLSRALHDLTQEQICLLCDVGGIEQGLKSFENMYVEVRAAWDEWRLALKWLVAASNFVGLHSGFSLWELYRDASSPSFASSTLPSIVTKLLNAMKKIDKGDEQSLLSKLEDILCSCENESKWLPVSARAAFNKIQQSFNGENAEFTDLNNDIGSEEANRHVESEATIGSSGVNALGKQKEKYLTKSSRTAALVSKINSHNQRNITRNSERRVVVWVNNLIGYISNVLKGSPREVKGSNLLLCKLGPMSNQLTASIRTKVHEALKQPEKFYMVENPQNSGNERMQALTEDTCVAYQLFDDDPSNSNLVDWFEAFESVLSPREGPSTKQNKDASKEFICRFSQCLQDLQFIGMIQASRKKKGDHVQRSIYMPLQV